MDGQLSRDTSRPVAGNLVAGKYRLKKPLRSGGMGVVWIAHHEVLDIDVAIKLLRFSGNDKDTARLLQEARAAASIANEGVVRIFDFGETSSGCAFIAMELLDGETLRDAMRRTGRMEPLEAIRMLLPIAHALCALADKGIVHRDIKPENIVLARTDDGRIQPKLLDFGLALIPGGKRITDIGTIVGTPQYFAPEQVLGDTLDARVDVWAFAVMLFEVISGRLPFVGVDVISTLEAIADGAPAPVEALGVHDHVLEGVISQALRRNPIERVCMHSFGAALASWAIANGTSEDLTGASLRTIWLGPGCKGDGRGIVQPELCGALTELSTDDLAFSSPNAKTRPIDAVALRDMAADSAFNTNDRATVRLSPGRADPLHIPDTLRSAIARPSTLPSYPNLRPWALASVAGALLAFVAAASFNWDHDANAESARPAGVAAFAVPGIENQDAATSNVIAMADGATLSADRAASETTVPPAREKSGAEASATAAGTASGAAASVSGKERSRRTVLRRELKQR